MSGGFFGQTEVNYNFMKVKVIKSVNEFLSLIHHTENFENNWFRGHKETEYRLEPNLYRSKKEVITGDDYIQFRHYEIEDEQLAIKEFKAKFSPSIDDYKLNDLDYLYLMQHNGIKTRLLDFTSNPLIALFFSVVEDKTSNENKEDWSSEDEFDENCSSVFCIDPKMVNKISFGVESIIDLSFLEFKKIKNLLTTVCIEPKNSKIDKRLEAQYGKFVLFGSEVNSLDWYDVPRKSMLKILIPNSKRTKILNELDRKFNINYMTVYPDNEGLKHYVNSKVKGNIKNCSYQHGFVASVAQTMEPVLNGTGGSLKREIIIV